MLRLLRTDALQTVCVKATPDATSPTLEEPSMDPSKARDPFDTAPERRSVVPSLQERMIQDHTVVPDRLDSIDAHLDVQLATL